jgi:hypothetical protein
LRPASLHARAAEIPASPPPMTMTCPSSISQGGWLFELNIGIYCRYYAAKLNCTHQAEKALENYHLSKICLLF